MEIYSDVNLKGNSLIDFVIDNRVSDPTGISGKVYYNASTSLLRYFDTSWKNIASENFVTTGLANKLDLVGGDLTGINGAGFHGFIAQATKPSTPTSGFRLYSNNSHAFSWIDQNGFTKTFDGLSNTADRTYTLPDISGTLTIGTGANGQVAFWTGSNVLSSDSSIFWNNITKRFGIGTNTPRAPLEISGDGLAQAGFGLLGINSSTRMAAFVFRENGGLKAWMGYGNNGDLLTATGYVDGSFVIRSESNLYFGANGNNLAMTVRSSGVTIGSSGVDEGFRLDVAGSFRARTGSDSAIEYNSGFFYHGGNYWQYPSSTDYNFGTRTTSSLIFRTNNSERFRISGIGELQMSSLTTFANSSGTTSNVAFTINSTINNTGTYSGIFRGILYNPTLTSLTGTTHRAIETVAGDVVIGSTSGNLLVGTTTSAGFRVDVSGSLRSSGSITCGGNILLTGSTRVDWSNGANTTAIEGSAGYLDAKVNSILGFRITNNGSFLIGTNINISSSILTLESTTRGFLPPRMTTAQINSIASPANGLLVYNTTIDYLCGYQAGAWVKYSHSPM